ncbi:MAG: LLM class flavin-dependent oxidoreductase [Candidatus Dormibacter sp.]|uniref:LLM class flavin-dependent oxidoreductase n=1 Tax=Candidatus Dormibacter sp. TaxID=2973982 RepID=UPI000DB22141|nr:MAG: MmcJ protein [Candidatus Dormibacteraeota bacterium]
MRIGIGIPNSIPGTTGPLLLEWAQHAEQHGFSTLATIGRVAYPTYDELVVLAAAAGATSRIALLTDVLLGPTREPVTLAKQCAALDQLAGGRFVLGVGVGGRPDDFEATGTSMDDRGRRWDHALELMHAAWRGDNVAGSPRPVTPRPVNGRSVPILIGGQSEQAVRRTVRWGAGWSSGGGGPERAAPMMERVRQAWAAAGREGRPEFRGLHYFALGERSELGLDYLTDYYGPMGERIWPSVGRDSAGLRAIVQAFAEVGMDELIFSPTIASVEQVDQLAAAVM